MLFCLPLLRTVRWAKWAMPRSWMPCARIQGGRAEPPASAVAMTTPKRDRSIDRPQQQQQQTRDAVCVMCRLQQRHLPGNNLEQSKGEQRCRKQTEQSSVRSSKKRADAHQGRRKERNKRHRQTDGQRDVTRSIDRSIVRPRCLFLYTYVCVSFLFVRVCRTPHSFCLPGLVLWPSFVVSRV